MGTGASILIVEDDLNVRDTIEDVLVEEGHRVATARNGAEGLITLGHLPRPTLILLDIWMPVMDGLGFLGALRAREDRDDFEVIVMSAAVAPEWFIHAQGVVRAMKKPFDVSEIVAIAAEFASRRSGAGASAATAGQEETGFVAAIAPPAAAEEE